MNELYVISAEPVLETFKVGISSDTEKRLRGLRYMCPMKLSLDYRLKLDNPRIAEAAVHAALRRFRITGEWFDDFETSREVLIREMWKWEKRGEVLHTT